MTKLFYIKPPDTHAGDRLKYILILMALTGDKTIPHVTLSPDILLPYPVLYREQEMALIKLKYGDIFNIYSITVNEEDIL